MYHRHLQIKASRAALCRAKGILQFVSSSHTLSTRMINASGMTIHWQTASSQPPDVLCLHGFSSSFRRNWYGAGWVSRLTDSGHGPFGPDLRGHGNSEKSHSHVDFHPLVHMGDINAGLDELTPDPVHVVGFSMGAAIALQFGMLYPERCKSLTLIAVGDKIIDTIPPPMEPSWIADALSTHHPDKIPSDIGRTFRQFAERGNNDLLALSAMMRTGGWPGRVVDDRPVNVPMRLIFAEKDTFMPTHEKLLQHFPAARHCIIPGTSHLDLALSQEAMKVTASFIDEHA